VTRFFDQPVGAKAAQNSGHLTTVVLREPSAQRPVLHPADGEFSAGEGQKKRFVILVEEVESTI